ncbi:MAG: zf-HC2 domain-containing protein [Bryobacteraceae bacterium]|jgi:anti-sigma factor RsiW
MKECLEEGGLRAYLDRELPPDEMTRIAVHVGGCAECHARYNELAGRAARVSALMETLEVGPVVSAPVQRRFAMPARSKVARPVATAVLALAAAAALAFVLLPKRAEAPKPMVAPHVAPVRQIMEQAVAPSGAGPWPALSSPPRAKSPRRVKPPAVQYYLALDDEPIDTGVVMRVALDGTGVQADVIFDADGRPRAIRAIK